MPLPDCPVPTHAEWKSLRDKAGGKEGLSKVNMGKKLDEFFAVLKGNDAAKATAAIKVMDAAAKAYASEVSKKLPKLAAVVNAEIVGKLKAFGAAMEAQGKAEGKFQDDLRKKFKQDLMTIIQVSNKLLAELAQIGNAMDAVEKKLKADLPAEQVPAVEKLLATFDAKLDTVSKEGWKLEKLAKPLESFPEPVKDEFKEGFGVAGNLMDKRRGLLRGTVQSMDGLKRLVGNAKGK